VPSALICAARPVPVLPPRRRRCSLIIRRFCATMTTIWGPRACSMPGTGPHVVRRGLGGPPSNLDSEGRSQRMRCIHTPRQSATRGCVRSRRRCATSEVQPASWARVRMTELFRSLRQPKRVRGLLSRHPEPLPRPLSLTVCWPESPTGASIVYN